MPPARPIRMLRAPLVGLLTIAAGSCYYSDAGLPPPTEGFYFPTGIVVSPGRTTLYVANSDFDLQYNGGTVQALDLTGMRSVLGKMLAGIRCSEGNASGCSDAQLPAGTLLKTVCNGIPLSRGSGAAGVTCSVPGDCQSGLCTGGACTACKLDADCPSGASAVPGGSVNDASGGDALGKCDAGVCMLARNDNQILTPSMCTPMAPSFAISGTVGAFASGAVIARNTDPTTGGARLFVPVRGDPSITWFDLADDQVGASASGCKAAGDACSAASDCCTGYCDPAKHACGYQLYCGQGTTNPRCDDDHRMGVDPYDNFRALGLPVEPVGLDVANDATDRFGNPTTSWIATAHQIAGGPAIGLSSNPWGAACRPHAAGTEVACPTFEYYLTGNVAPGPSEVADVPAPKVVKATRKTVKTTADAACPVIDTNNAGCHLPMDYEPGFLVTYNASAQVDLFRVNPDADSNPARPFLTRVWTTPITVNQSGSDSRGIVLDPSERQACEAACAETDLACLRACVDYPLRVFIANRAPPSLLIGRVRTQVVDSGSGTGAGAFDTVEVFGQTSLALGPSKVALGAAIAPDGTVRTHVFAVTFDSRFIFMYDPQAERVVQVIRTGRGPHAIAFDHCTTDCKPGEAPHAYLYVGHFTDSYLGVVDLDMRHPETFGTMFASIGAPLPPLESK